MIRLIKNFYACLRLGLSPFRKDYYQQDAMETQLLKVLARITLLTIETDGLGDTFFRGWGVQFIEGEFRDCRIVGKIVTSLVSGRPIKTFVFSYSIPSFIGPITKVEYNYSAFSALSRLKLKKFLKAQTVSDTVEDDFHAILALGDSPNKRKVFKRA